MSREITEILDDVNQSIDGSVAELFAAIYEELRAMAHRRMQNEKSGHTLPPTALVHEAYLKLLGNGPQGWGNRSQFFSAAATAMRRVLVDHARTRNREKRGGGMRRFSLDESIDGGAVPAESIIAVHDALEGLATRYPRKSKLVELRFFVGLQHDEIADILGVSERTVKREWSFAKAWLYRELSASA